MSLLQKIGIGIASVLVIIAIGTVLYSRFRRPAPTEVSEPTLETPTPEPAVLPYIAGTFADLTASADGKTLGYLDTATFGFVRYDLATSTPTQSSVKTVPDQVVWSDDLAKVLVKATNIQSASTENPDFVADRPENAIVWSVFDLTSGERQLLPDGITQAAWLGAGVVGAQVSDGVTRFVSIAADSQKETKIAEIKEPLLEWKAAPGGATIVAWTRSDQATIYLIDVAKKQVAQVKGSGSIKDFTISPDAALALFNAKSGPEQRLFKIDLATRTITKSEQKIDLSLVGWLAQDRLGVINADQVVEYQPIADTLTQTDLMVTTKETIRMVVAAGGQLYVLTDSGIFKPELGAIKNQSDETSDRVIDGN
ncbi:hypothetical protein HYZ64_00275 [Candidatus Berkelbacteria bacterium]|nr:hypothetical protein [Candidatus Berkelbacteria bacterium]